LFSGLSDVNTVIWFSFYWSLNGTSCPTFTLAMFLSKVDFILFKVDFFRQNAVVLASFKK
jgi:hypothetical protein